MTLLIDAMAERYGYLPSEIVRRADTYDIYVMDVAISYQARQQNISSNKLDQVYDQPEMINLMERVRGQHKN